MGVYTELAEMAQGLVPDQVLFVDIGGNFGQESIKLRDQYPMSPVLA
jgi:hypothetical protein